MDATTSSWPTAAATPISCAHSCGRTDPRPSSRTTRPLRAIPRRTRRTDRRGRTVSVGVAAATGHGGEHVVTELDDRRRALRHRRSLLVRQRRVELPIPPGTNHITFLHGAFLSSLAVAAQKEDRRPTILQLSLHHAG